MPNLSDRISCVSNSYTDPSAISKKCLKSLSVPLPEPSAIFEGTETEHLLI